MAHHPTAILILKLLPLIVATISIQANLSNAVARTIKIPLTSEITQQAGIYGQPVISYYTQVNIGTPSKLFKIQFDTALNELFVPHYEWSVFKPNLHYRNGFQCKKSSTCKKTDLTYTFDYQNCQLKGKPYEDVMTFSAILNEANHKFTPVQVRQNFLAIKDASDGRFKDLPIDGSFGLGPVGRSASTINSLLSSLHNAGLIDNLQFAFWFNPILDYPAQGGELVLGGVNEQRYAGKLFWHQLQAIDQEWALNLQQVSLGNQAVGCVGRRCRAVLSSGVNEVIGPKADVRKIYSLLGTSPQADGVQLIDCRRIPQLPILSFILDGLNYALYPTNYIRKTTSGSIFKKETCYVAIFGSDSADRWVLGTNFMGAYYSVFDLTYRQVGFAGLR